MRNTTALAPLVLAAALAAALAGCAATQPPPPTQARPVPPERTAAAEPTASPTPALVRITRDVGYIGSAAAMHLWLDGRRVATLQPGEFIEFRADPGARRLSALPVSIFKDRHPTVLPVAWQPGRQYHYRLGMDGNYAVNLLPADQ